jgi:hypothetical protein
MRSVRSGLGAIDTAALGVAIIAASVLLAWWLSIRGQALERARAEGQWILSRTGIPASKR